MRYPRGPLVHQFWEVVEIFFDSQRAFLETYDTYETKVLQYAAERGVDRRFLRLDADEVSDLLDFKKLEQLRNDKLWRLKEVAHHLFRTQDATDPFDRYVSEIFHELSILKEEQYKVSMFAREYRKADETQEYQSILDEVHEAFPRKVHNIYDLFKKAQARLEQLVSRYRQDKVTLRSVYLFGDEVFRGFYPNATEDILRLMFSDPFDGYLAIARSFIESGFREYAIEALERAMKLPPPLAGEIAAPADGGSADPGAAAGPGPESDGERREALRREAEELLRELRSAGKKKPAAAR